MQALEETAAESPHGAVQTAALLNLLRGLADYVSRDQPGAAGISASSSSAGRAGASRPRR